jgi:hypothetical protein
MLRLFRWVRSTVILLWLCAALAVSAVTLGVHALTLSAQVAAMSASASAAAMRHRKEMARAKAKARLRRLVVAVPFVGGGAVLAFETQEFRAWQDTNPEGTFGDYSCEVAELSAEVVDEVLRDLPDRMRPSRDMVLNQLPDCAQRER